MKWTISATNLGNYNSQNYAGVQIGSSKNNGSITLTSSSEWNYEDCSSISEIRLWLNLGGTSVTPTVKIDGNAATSDGTTVVKNLNAADDYTKATKVTFTPATGHNSGVVEIKVDTVKAGYICAIEIVSEYYNVTFDSNGGSNVDSLKVYKGEKIHQPSNPTKTHNIFEGWYWDDDNNNETALVEWDFNNSSIEKDVVLIAMWSPAQQYTLSFNSNGGSSVDSQTKYSDELFEEPEKPTKLGLEFAGWYKEAEFVNEYDFSSPITEDLTLYAKWVDTVTASRQNEIDNIDSYMRLAFEYTEVDSPVYGYSLYTGNITEGDYIIYYDDKAMKSSVTSDRLDYSEVSQSENIISTNEKDIVWHISQSGDYWTLYNSDAEKYAASTGAKNKAQLLDNGSDDKALWTITGTETYEFVNKANAANEVNSNLRNNGTYGFACYSNSTGGALTLYKYQQIGTQKSYSSFNNFYLGVAVDSSLNDIEADDIGIKVSQGSKTKFYSAKDLEVSEDKKYLVQTISLGDVIAKNREDDVFTVSAYSKYGEDVFVSSVSKEYSVKGLVAEYLNPEKDYGLDNEIKTVLAALLAELG